ncbi:MAG: hypothetical protein JKX68_04420 [Flavobacteriales bacterium]|nr:hypothetical protein [Flavobacteriales bacterium]
MKKAVLLLLIFTVSFLANSQNKTEFTLSLKDGSVVTGSTKITKITLVTDYGKLEIPIKNVTSIELGLHADYSQKSKISNLIKQLSNSNNEIRENAYKAITTLSASAIPIIEEIMFSSEYDPGEFSDFSLSTAVNELKSAHNVSDNYKSKDIVSIDYEYNMGGKYDFKTIELKTEYGTLTIPRAKIDKIDVMFYDASDGGMKTFKLFATTHISGNNNGGWLKTGIMVKKGQSIDIISSGEVTFASLSGNKYKPDGAYKGATSDKFTANVSTSTYPVYGNAVFKIGESGTSKSAGAKYKGKADANGMLYFSIYETVYNASNTGYYIVKLKIR